MDGISSIARLPIDHSNLYVAKPAQANPDVNQAAMVNVARAQNSDITIVTAEGDTVTFSSSRSTELSFTTYNAQGQQVSDSGDVSAKSAEFRTSSEFSFTVEGDLNKKELREIRRAIKTIQKATRDVLRDDEEKAAERTATLSRLDQLASIDADVQFRQEFSIVQSVNQQSSDVPQQTSDEDPRSAPASTSLPASIKEEPVSSPAPLRLSLITNFEIAIHQMNSWWTAQPSLVQHKSES